MDLFERALAFTVVRMEGGYVNDPADPGGATNRGVTQTVYDAWRRGQGFPIRPVRVIDDAEVRAIYRDRYWTASGADALPWPLALVHFDAAVNNGVARAALLRKDAADDALTYLWLRVAFYRALPKTRPESLKFLPGWIWRMEQLKLAIWDSYTVALKAAI